MNEPYFSPRSVEDLDEILTYIAAHNPGIAIDFVAALKDTCRSLARFPEMGARRDEIAEGLRAMPVGNYVIYYTAYRDSVRIERILHTARDRETIFGRDQ